ncbi:CHRD domain-containing protein [Flavobacterium sp. LS2P90]|uniref:CHRD domain-containing protein n=1 Tax=Flavobacterium xylosi TaxID=3230415 RepID=A0ABW6HX89_9FLAO
MKKLISLFTALFLLVSLSSCNDDEATPGPNITTFSADMLMGSNEVPANNSTAKGTATLKFNNTTKVFTITVTHNLSSISAGHIHKGAAGTNGSVVFPFTSLASPISYTSAALTPEQEADLMANLYYVNLHSSTFTAGEIRGQLIKGTTTTSNTGGGY